MTSRPGASEYVIAVSPFHSPTILTFTHEDPEAFLRCLVEGPLQIWGSRGSEVLVVNQEAHLQGHAPNLHFPDYAGTVVMGWTDAQGRIRGYTREEAWARLPSPAGFS